MSRVGRFESERSSLIGSPEPRGALRPAAAIGELVSTATRASEARGDPRADPGSAPSAETHIEVYYYICIHISSHPSGENCLFVWVYMCLYTFCVCVCRVVCPCVREGTDCVWIVTLKGNSV